MAHDRYITIKVAYDSHPSYGRSLEWIAPELSDANLTLIEDRIDGPRPSRTWAGAVDESTFKRFADAWHLDHATGEKSPTTSTRTYTLDGMNWESGGKSPIVYVSVRVGVSPHRHRTAALCG